LFAKDYYNIFPFFSKDSIFFLRQHQGTICQNFYEITVDSFSIILIIFSPTIFPPKRTRAVRQAARTIRAPVTQYPKRSLRFPYFTPSSLPIHPRVCGSDLQRPLLPEVRRLRRHGGLPPVPGERSFTQPESVHFFLLIRI